MLSILTLASFVVWLLYRVWTSAYSYWESRGIPSIPGIFPFGSKSNLTLLKQFQGYSWEEAYQELSPHPYGGLYVLRNPVLLLRDPEVIKLVLVKEFAHFRNRHGFKRGGEKVAQHLFNLEDETWRAVRIKLTPTFSSGKLKAMFPLFLACSQGLESVLKSGLGGVMDAKEVTSRFSMDIIGTCAFGLDFQSLHDPHSEFRRIGKEIFKTNISIKLKMALTNAFPLLTTVFVPRFTPEKVETFLLQVVKEATDYRKETGLKRNDFLDLLIQLRDQGPLEEPNMESIQHVEMTLEMMTAQCFVFFTAGFETSGSVQSFCLYELALHPEIQDRVAAEIHQVMEAHGGLTYQAINSMTYLDMVVSETMRKYPTFPVLTRRCSKSLVLPGGHRVEEGTRLVIPVWALHRDPKYFPNPDKFDPERFSPTNRVSIPPFTYLPFGEGPRVCIGIRFGLLQTKMGLITVLRKYQVQRIDSARVPLSLAGSGLITATAQPIHLKLTPRIL